MLGLEFYSKVEKLMNKKYMKHYHGKAYFCIDKVEISCIEGDFTSENCLITLKMRWGIEGNEGDTEESRDYTLHHGLKTVKQVCEALYTVIQFCEQMLYE